MTSLNYSNQNLQNRSFKGQQLAGADFSGSDLRGCDFAGASLIGAKFQQVMTGQSQRQANLLVVATVASPIVLFGSSIIFVQVLYVLFNERAINLLFGALPVLALLAEIFLRDSILYHFPKMTNFLSIGAIAILLAAMSVVTIFLGFIGFSSLSNNVVQGFFFLVLMVVAANISFRIFRWLLQSIQTHPGTSFKKANLTDADFSYALVQNTDFSFAILTGVCVFNWVIKSYNKFTNIDCKYLYLEPDKHQRQPAEGNFHLTELARVFSNFHK